MTTPKIYNDINEVLKLYPKIYYENDTSKNKKLEKFVNELYVSPNVFAKTKDGTSLWKQSYNVAEKTLGWLSILGEPFGIKFYVAVFEQGKLKHFVKYIQEPKETVEQHYKTLGLSLSNILDKKAKLKPYEISQLKHKKLELMNCILQDKPESDEKHQYHSLLERLTMHHIIPDGMYIFSLRDTLLIHKYNHPWINFWKTEEKRFDKYTGSKACKDRKSRDMWYEENMKLLPIFNTTGAKDYYDIPIVEYETLNYINDKFYKYKDKYEFVNKDFSTKVPKAIFRGSATGCGYDEENVRLHLAKLSSKTSDNPYLQKILDIGITAGKRKFIYNSQGKIGILDLDAYLKKYDIKRGEFMDKPTQSNYKYILIAEGNVSAHRIASDLLLNSVILLIDSMYTVWCSHLMIPYVHYIPIAADLSDLEKQLKYCEAHPEEMKAVAHEARKLGEKLLTPKSLEINIIDSLRLS